MGRRLGRTPLLWVLWSCVLSLAAQQSGDPIRVRVTLVPVEVLVTDRHHRPVLDLSREDLLPADRVAVMAYHRATDFTTDHEKIARVLERYRDLSPEIEATPGTLSRVSQRALPPRDAS